MNYLNVDQVRGDLIEMQRTHPRHLNAGGDIPMDREKPGTGFGQGLTQAVNRVHALQQNTSELAERMIVDPDSVDVHDVSIAIAKANTSLQMTKTIVDSALRAYREIISIR